MPAPNIANAAIPDLAKSLSKKSFDVLRRVQQAGYAMHNRDRSSETTAVLEELTELGLLDVAFEGDERERPYLWSMNGNGLRVLEFLTGIRSAPHYEIQARELAAWLEDQGEDRWWTVDGDPLVSGRIVFPSPASSLANELRRIDRPLLVRAKNEDSEAKGQLIEKEKINEIVGHFADNIHVQNGGDMPRWSSDRLLDCC